MVHPGLGGIVVRLPLRFVGDQARHRADRHDRALPTLKHGAAELAAAPVDAVEVDVDDLAPDLVRHRLARGVGPSDAGVGDQNVDAAVALIRLRRCPPDRMRVGDIEADGVDGPALELELGGSGVEDGWVVVGKHDLGTALEESLGRAEADPSAARR